MQQVHACQTRWQLCWEFYFVWLSVFVPVQGGLLLHPFQLPLRIILSLEDHSATSSIINPGRSNVKILKRIPRASREQASTKLATILDNVAAENSVEAWERLFLFCGRCLFAPSRGGRRRSLASHVNQAIFAEKTVDHQDSAHFRPTKDPLKSFATRIACKLEEGDFRGAVRLASSDENFATVNEETFLPTPILVLPPDA